MPLRRLRLVLVLASLASVGCGQSNDSAPSPAVAATAPAPLPAQPAQPTQPTFTASNAVVYRWTDGDWIVRVHVDVFNGTSQPYTTTRGAFVPQPAMTAWSTEATFPETAQILPGQRVSGTVSWYTSGSGPAPVSVTLTNGAWTQAVALVEAPLRPSTTAAITAVTGSVTTQFTGSATTWRHTDQDHIVRAPVQITNNTNVPLSIPRGYFRGEIDGTEGSSWGSASTIADPLELAPGASANGFVSWYWDDALPVPTQVTARLGSSRAPLATATLPVAQGTAP